MTRRSTAPPLASRPDSNARAGPRRAAILFQSALVSPDLSIACLARLFLGSLKERDGHFAEAEALYRDAGRRVPYGQAAPLALAQLLVAPGA